MPFLRTRVERNLVDEEVKGNNSTDDMNLSDHNTSSENATKRQLPVFLLPNSTSQACNDGDVFEASPVKARRKMIDLQLPAHEYLDTDENDEITICAPYKRSKSGRGDDASHHINSSGSCLDVKNSTGLLADLNEPLTLQGSEPVPHNADVEGQSSQNGCMVLDAGHGGSTQSQRDLHIPSPSDNAVQPQRQSYPATDYSNATFSRERAHREMEARSVNPQASYDSYVESTVASSNAPRLHNDYRPDFIRPWSHLSSPWKNPRCITDQHKEVNHLLKRDFDINLPCDDASVSVDQLGAKAFGLKKEGENKAANVRHCFDLNACASEDDDVSGLHSSLRVKTKGTFSIDLEAPPTLQSAEEEDGDSSQDELIKVAAEAIVAISLPDHPDDAASYSTTDVASKSQLSWFADIITSCGDELERKIDGSPQEYSSGEIDYFEAMTLSLQPTKEEDYMPEPLVPENMSFEGTGLNKPRRGKARRGRPKRGDFQRDTLPGLSSLSRHEVAEDIQLFGGLMRLRATGWGKATRRPRRQRCPPATVILT